MSFVLRKPLFSFLVPYCELFPTSITSKKMLQIYIIKSLEFSVRYLSLLRLKYIVHAYLYQIINIDSSVPHS